MATSMARTFFVANIAEQRGYLPPCEVGFLLCTVSLVWKVFRKYYWDKQLVTIID